MIPIHPNFPLIISATIGFTLISNKPLWTHIKGLFQRKSLLTDKEKGFITKKLTAAFSKTKNPLIAVELLRDAINKIIHPKRLLIFLYDPEKDGYTAQHQAEDHETRSLFVPSDSIIATTLVKNEDLPSSLEKRDDSWKNDFPKNLSDLMESSLFIPIPGGNGLLGWVTLTLNKQNEKLSNQDIELIRMLTQQFSMCYERAKHIVATELPIQDMETLNHIATAVNSHDDLDQLMDSIFNQVQSLFDIDSFSLVVTTETSHECHRLFLIEQGKKIISCHQPQPLGAEFIEKDAIIQGNTMNVIAESNWLVIPLQTGDKTIGAISLGNVQTSPVPEQLNPNLINIIANLVTNAIVKTDMLQTSHHQAQQISVFKKISSQLTTSARLDQLLKSILEGAIETVQCSSGILLVVDKKMDMFEIKVTVGPIRKHKQAKWLPLTDGMIGKSYLSHKPIISNIINQATLRLSGAEPETPSLVKNILMMPLIAHGNVVGILKLINSNHAGGFTLSDQSVLEGFAYQAAIALYNASIINQTSWVLEEKLEELSLMQEIDRALSTTKDFAHAMQVVLKAALMHTSAKAGSIGLVDYADEIWEDIWQILPDKEDPLPVDRIKLNNLSWFSKALMEPVVIKCTELAKLLLMSKENNWHYIVLYEVDDDQFVLMSLHINSPDQLNSQHLNFLARLNEHVITALKHAYLYEDLHDAIREKNEFISFISHELKTPLTVIKGYADILSRGMAGEINNEQKDYLMTIAHNVRQMNKFIKDLSDQAYIETKSLRLDFATTSVNEVVNEVLQTYEAQIKDKSLHVQKQIELQISNVWCDRLRLIQILSNLLSNAIKYTPGGGTVIIGAENSANQWDKAGAAEVVHFWVKDNGYGISPEDQAHMFEKFYRGTDSNKLKVSGSGLGLRIAKSLTEMMGGKMWFNSRQGEGSAFHFTMPM